jgi:hypothetical protein
MSGISRNLCRLNLQRDGSVFLASAIWCMGSGQPQLARALLLSSKLASGVLVLSC